jgi:hypothetical protein
VVRPFRLPRLRSDSARLAALATVFVAAVLLLQTTEGPGALASAQVALVSHASPHGPLEVTLEVSSHRPWPLPIRAALLPVAFTGGASRVAVLEDPNYPALFGTTPEVAALVSFLGTEFQRFGSTTGVTTLDAAQLPSFLTGNRSATLVVANYGCVPASVLSAQNDSLPAWVRGGGRLVWAGGPLGYYEEPAHPSAGGPLPGGLGWAGQLRVLGFPLVDPLPAGPQGPEATNGSPVLGSVASPLAQGLGLAYNGTTFGANLSELIAHGGFSLGFESAPLASGASGRTSIAYLPVGNGSVVYFGGAVDDPANQYIPEGGVRLAQDIALLLAFPFLVVPGPVDVQELDLAPLGSARIQLSVSAPPSSAGVLVQSNVGGAVLFAWSQPILP